MTTWLAAVAVAPIALALVVMGLRNPMGVALPLFVALVPFGKALSIGTSSFGSLSSLAGMLLAAGLALQLVTPHRAAPRLSPSVPVWLLFLGTAAVTYLWTIDRTTTVDGLIVLGSLVLVFVLAAMSAVDRTAMRRTENGVLAGGVAAVLYGLYQLIVLGGFPDDTPGAGVVDDGRFGNDMLGPGVTALALLPPLVIALNRAFAGGPASSRWLNGVIAAMMLWGILMTGSRTGTLAVALALVALAWAGPRRARRPLIVTFVVALLLAVLVWVFQPAGVASRSFESPTSSSGRTDIWQVGLASCPEHCVKGSGWGTFPEVYAQYQASVPGARVLVGKGGSYQPHNLWLLAVVELGIAGLVLLAWGLGMSLIEAARLPRDRRGPLVSLMVGLLVAVFFLSSMEFKVFWLILILVAMNRTLVLSEAQDDAADRPDTGLAPMAGHTN